MKRTIHEHVESDGLGRVETFLTHRFWRTQVQVTQMGQYPYGRHMKPSCFEVPIGITARWNHLSSSWIDRFFTDSQSTKHPQVLLEKAIPNAYFVAVSTFSCIDFDAKYCQLPYLHWEYSGRKGRAEETLQHAWQDEQRILQDELVRTHRRRAERVLPEYLMLERGGGYIPRVKRACGNMRGSHSGRRYFTFHILTHIIISLTYFRGNLGRFLMIAAKLCEMMHCESDERLLKQGVVVRNQQDNALEPLMHLRRTLHQFNQLSQTDASQAGQDQVLYRATGTGPQPARRIVMVDQLWMWVVDKCAAFISLLTLFRGQRSFSDRSSTSHRHNSHWVP